jgi:hypothetical protein
VEVISAEHTSQTYLTPPSPPRTAVFLRMTPMPCQCYGAALLKVLDAEKLELALEGEVAWLERELAEFPQD